MIEQIKLSQKFAIQAKHEIEFENNKYEDFMGTKFIYSMITFNIIYDKYSGRFVWEKITNLVEDIFNSEENLSIFYKNFNNQSNDFNLDIIRHIADDNNIKKINESDKNISKRTYKQCFIDAFNNMINNENATKEEILLILLYINQIRNNLFHGSKDIRHAIEGEQNKRLKLYSDIILAVNEVYIKSKS